MNQFLIIENLSILKRLIIRKFWISKERIMDLNSELRIKCSDGDVILSILKALNHFVTYSYENAYLYSND